MAKPFPVPRVEQLSVSLGALIEDLRTSLRLPPELEKKLVTAPTAPPMNLIRLVGTLPAAEEWHDEGPAGLASHSLKVAARIAQIYRQRYPEPVATSPDHLDWQRRLIGTYLAGLQHDLGKLWFIDVVAANQHWPAHRYLCDWVGELLKNGASFTEIQVSHRPRTRGGPAGHEPLSLYFSARVVPPGLVPLMGFQTANDVLASLTFTLGSQPSDDSFAIVHEADVLCTGEDREKRRSPSTKSLAKISNYAVGSGGLADDFIHGFRRLAVAETRLRFNTLDAHVLVSPTHSVLWVTSTDARSVFRAIYDAVRADVHKHGLAGYVKSFYEAGDPNRFIDELKSRTAGDGEPWCLPSAGEGDALTIRHHLVVTDANGRRNRKGYGIIIRNSVLWGDQDSTPHGVFAGRIGCYTDSRKLVSCDPDEIGFTPLLDLDRPAKLKPIRVSTMIPTGGGDGILDMETVAAALVREIAALVPDAGDQEQQRAWSHLVAGAGDRMPSATVLSGLEACLDRLRHLRVRGPSTTVAVAVRPPYPLSSSAAPPEPPRPNDLIRAVAGLIQAARQASAQPVQEPFHAHRAEDGAIIIPWPQGLDGVVETALALQLRDKGADVAKALGVTLGQVKVPGLTYGGVRKSHLALIVPPTWRPVGDVIEPHVELVVLG